MKTQRKATVESSRVEYQGRDAILEAARRTRALIQVMLPMTDEDRAAGRPVAIRVDVDSIHENEVAYQYRYKGYPDTSAAGWGHIYIRSLGV